MEKHLEDLENQLLEQEKKHKQILYDLERKAVVDKDRFFFTKNCFLFKELCIFPFIAWFPVH